MSDSFWLVVDTVWCDRMQAKARLLEEVNGAIEFLNQALIGRGLEPIQLRFEDVSGDQPVPNEAFLRGFTRRQRKPLTREGDLARVSGQFSA